MKNQVWEAWGGQGLSIPEILSVGLPGDDIVEDLVESHQGFASDRLLQEIHAGDSPLHIFEVFAVGAVVGQEGDF